MLDKVTAIRNPLTIIAIFAGLAEISGTGVLPLLNGQHQGVFMWFLMVFPILLVSFFFLTLNFNHKSLYAPSDFRDEDNFFKSLRPASAAALALKLKDDLQEADVQTHQATSGTSTPRETSKFDHHARNRWAVDLALFKIGAELGGELQRDVTIGPAGKTRPFDGVVLNEGEMTAIEVIYDPEGTLHPDKLRREVERFFSERASLGPIHREKFALVIAIVTDRYQANILKRAHAIIGMTEIPIRVLAFNIEELERDVLGSR